MQTIDSASQELQQRVAFHLKNRGSPVVADCEAKHGTVTLSGRVPTFYLRQLIDAATRKVAGVIKVIDQVEVEAEPKAGSQGGGRIIAGWKIAGTVLK